MIEPWKEKKNNYLEFFRRCHQKVLHSPSVSGGGVSRGRICGYGYGRCCGCACGSGLAVAVASATAVSVAVALVIAVAVAVALGVAVAVAVFFDMAVALGYFSIRMDNSCKNGGKFLCFANYTCF